MLWHLHSCLSIPADSKPGLWDDYGRTSTNGIVATTKLVCNRANKLKQTANNVDHHIDSGRDRGAGSRLVAGARSMAGVRMVSMTASPQSQQYRFAVDVYAHLRPKNVQSSVPPGQTVYSKKGRPPRARDKAITAYDVII